MGNCVYCNHEKKVYFAQVISNGKKVVSQRCAKCLRSWKGQPFVSTIGFDWNSLPRWDASQDKPVSDDSPLDIQHAPEPSRRLVRGQVGYLPPELPR